jgi:hypothetical protein
VRLNSPRGALGIRDQATVLGAEPPVLRSNQHRKGWEPLMTLQETDSAAFRETFKQHLENSRAAKKAT